MDKWAMKSIFLGLEFWDTRPRKDHRDWPIPNSSFIEYNIEIHEGKLLS